MTTTNKKCPGCFRAMRECYTSPCLYLEWLKGDPPRYARWLRAMGKKVLAVLKADAEEWIIMEARG